MTEVLAVFQVIGFILGIGAAIADEKQPDRVTVQECVNKDGTYACRPGAPRE